MYKLINLKGNTKYINAFTNVGVFVKDNNVTLIDSGLDTEDATQIDQALLLNNLKVNNIIITHAHADHMGGAKYFEEKYSTKVLSTLADTAICNQSLMNTSLIYGGMPINIAKGKMLYANSCKTELITNDNLPSGLKIIDLKGHSINMIGVLTEDNVLFVADALISEKTMAKFPITYILDIENYYTALEKIINIKADIYVPSHAEVTTDITTLVEKNRDNVKKNIVDIMSVLTEPLEVNDIVFNYCKKFNYTLKKSQFFVVTTTIKNYLAYLEKINLVEGYLENNRLYFRKK